MRRKNKHIKDDLRIRAEKRLEKQTSANNDLTPESKDQLIHELQVHQVELTLQNEELRNAQEQLLESRDRYTDLFDFAPNGYFIIDNRGIVREANLTGCKLFGLERARMINTPFSKFITRESQDDFYMYRLRALESGLIETCELNLKNSKGKEFTGRLESVVTGENKNQQQLRIAVTDITEFKQTQALKENEERLRLLIQGAAEGVLMTDEANTILMANTSIKQLFGYQEDQLIGENIKFLLPAFKSYQPPPPRRTHSARKIELIGLRKNRTHFMVELCRSAFMIGRKQMFAYFLSDISERKQKEAVRIEAIREGQEQENEWIANELREGLAQQLVAVKMMLSSIQNDLKSEDKTDIKTFINSVKILTEAIEVAVDISHNLAPTLVKETGLFAAIKSLCETYHSSILEIRFQHEGIDSLIGESMALELFKIVRELLTNVLQHSKADFATVDLLQHEKGVTLTVTDDGIGIKEPINTIEKGIGLKNIETRIKGMAGHFDLKTTEGKGTKIIVEVPFQQGL